MALIKCKECGKEVSSLAKNCPNCGTPIMVVTKVKVHFWRKKKFGGSAITGSIFIDGQHVGIAHNGCEFDVYLPVGNHTISTETTINQYGTGGKGDSRNIQILESMNQVNIELIPKSTFSTGGFAYLAIKDVVILYNNIINNQDDIKKDNVIENNSNKDVDNNNVTQIVKSTTNQTKKATSKSITKPTQSKQNENNDRVRVDYDYNLKQNNSNIKINPFVKLFKFFLSTILKLILLIIIVLTLINYNNKYKITDAPFLKNIFNFVDNASSNLFVNNSNDKNTKEAVINEQIDNKQIKKEQVNKESISNDNKTENVTLHTKEIENSEISNNNFETKVNDSNVNEKVSHDAVKLSTNIKKINLKGAKWQFNNKQNAWNLLINNQISKNIIYIIDYTNPITGEPCSSTYGFEPNGKMIVGWGIDNSNNYYYFDDNTYDIGKMCTGWKEIDGNKYYFESNGRLLTDGITPDGYFVDINGLLVTKTNDMNNNLKNANDLQLKDYNHSTR